MSFNDITMDDINSAADGAEPIVDPVAPAEPVVAPAEPAPEPAAPITQHPWDTDLEFVPADQRDKVSAYLAEKWQPRMTQYEQDLKEWRDAFDGNVKHRDLGASLIQAFKDDPYVAFVQMGVEMGYLDPADVEGYLDPADVEGYGETLTPTDGEPANAADDSHLTADERELLDWARTRKETEEQETLRQTLHGHYHDLAKQYGIEDEFDVATFDKAFGGAQGDPEESVIMYKAIKAYQAAQGTPAPTTGEVAPPVLSDHTGGQAPPEEEHYDTFADATKALLAESRAREGR